ncbi:PIN domain-containing protein [Xanthobacter sp. KR7-225]|uniref:type II toxin-antitoxin system VapC family toxin n=1 Tax=Xanthobacter sp. KR7-225 TaxID=3156613 RepID=UPI0032B3C798
MAPRAYLDANVFIAALEHVGAHSDHAWWVLSAIEDGEVEGVTSEITLAEILVKPMERRDEGVITAYQSMISSVPGFMVPSVDRAILIDAARLRTTQRALKLPDAVHVATAWRSAVRTSSQTTIGSRSQKGSSACPSLHSRSTTF